MFQREILQLLSQWVENDHRKPLVLRGARQVGKTTVVNELGKQFDNYLYLNLENEQTAKLFEIQVTTEELIILLFAQKNMKRKEGRTLIFMDEIQNSPKAVAKLRYFYEETPEIYVIAAGSLLESLIDVHISFPVGRVQYMTLRPCSFREYLGAMGENSMGEILKMPRMTIAFHETLMKHFNFYTTIGGMPEVVSEYAQHRDIVRLSSIYDSLLKGYQDDVEKYAKGEKQTDVIRFILSEGWSKAGQTIKLGNFAGSSYKASDVGNAFRTLEKTMLLELVYPSTSADLPAIGELKRSPKLIWLDTGLVNYSAQIQKEIFGSMDIMSVWRGMIAEQIVAQELLTLDNSVNSKRKFWLRGNDSSAEVDFIYIHNSKVYPIEVKSGHKAHLKSLHSFMDRSSNHVGIRVWTEPFSIDEVVTATGKPFKLINLPFYLIGMLPHILDEIV